MIVEETKEVRVRVSNSQDILVYTKYKKRMSRRKQQDRESQSRMNLGSLMQEDQARETKNFYMKR